MKKLLTTLVLAATLLLSGCVWQSVDSTDLIRAAHKCQGIELISKISSHALGPVTVECINGDKFALNSIK